MSELTQCNHCSMASLRRRAEQDRQRLVILPAIREDKYFMGGVDVFRFPKAIYTRAQFRKLTPEQQKQWRVCWFMELGDHCCC